MSDRDKIHALRDLGEAIFGRNNLIGSDFDDVDARVVERKFEQDSRGVRIQFCISTHALGKVMSKEASAALDILLDEKRPD